MSNNTYLIDQFLIAMPGLTDSIFSESLVYLFEHGEQGAMGVIVNQPIELTLGDILEQLRPEQPATAEAAKIRIHAGGPVQVEHGFVFHSSEQSFQNTITLGSLSLTTSRDVLFAIADGNGPNEHFIALGYSGWGSEQLHNELKSNFWLSCPSRSDIIFSTPTAEKRAAAAASLGVQLNQLSQHAGNA